MRTVNNLRVRPFEPRDQDPARRLIVQGLGAHFGHVDEALNVDLVDIAAAYASAVFLVAEHRGRIIGTGALTPEADGTARIQRMSTAPEYRRRGVATAIVRTLVAHARERGHSAVVLNTVADWDDAVAFYTASGFTPESTTSDGDMHFRVEL